MELKISTYLIMGIAFFFAGIIDAVSGGGGLVTLPTFILTGFPVHLIAGTNQCSCLFGGFTAMYRYIKSGKIFWLTACISAINAIVGSILGAKLNLLIPDNYLQTIMIIILPLVAIFILFNRNIGQKNESATLTKKQLVIRAVLIGFILGAYTGFYGAGGGTFILLAFIVLTKLDLITASGNARMCSVAASLTAAITFAFSNAVVWPIVFCATVFNIIGNYIGAGLALRNGARVIRPMFMIVLILLFIRLISTFII